MNYKPDQKDWMAYLYGELEDQEKEKFDLYLLENAQARKELANYKSLRGMMASVEDKEVIAPQIVSSEGKQHFLWNAPYLKTVMSIAASLLLLMVIGKLTGTQLSIKDNEVKLSFGSPAEIKPIIDKTMQASLTEAQVQQMINSSLQNNNIAITENWKQNEEKLTASIKKNLTLNSGKINQLIREASNASQDHINQYVSGIQTENMKQVKDYFQLTSSEQKKYIENLLVDFAQYLQQQRNNDLQVVQTRMNSIEKNTDHFKQETEQILTSIITTVGSPNNKEIKN